MEFAKVDDTTGVLTFNRWPGIEIRRPTLPQQLVSSVCASLAPRT